MTKILPAALLGLFAAVTSGAHAADLATNVQPAVEDFASSGLYAIAFGGVSLTGAVDFVGGVPSDLFAGPALGAAIGWNTGLGGLSLELDTMFSRHQAESQSNIYFGTVTVMANAKYSFVLSDNLDVYAGAGLGAYGISSQYEPDPVVIDWSTGYQVMAGAELAVTDSISVLAEYRYQNSFAAIDIDGEAFVPNSALLGGLKISF